MSATSTTMLDGATVSRTDGVSRTEYRVVGELEAVFEMVKSIFINYDVRGYSTHVHAIGMESDGQYYARVSRLNCCD